MRIKIRFGSTSFQFVLAMVIDPGMFYLEVLFLESARIDKLLREQQDFDELLHRLQAGELERRAVLVGLASVDGDVIEDVQLSKP